MADIAKLGFEVNGAPLKQAADELDRMKPAAIGAAEATDKFNKRIREGHGGLSTFMHRMRELTGEIKGELRMALIGVAAGFGATFGATELIHHIAETSEGLDRISKAARAVGSNISAMQALSTAGQLAGVGVDVLATATRRNNRVLGDAIATGKGTSGVFKELGLSAQSLAAMPIDVRFMTIADRMKTLGFNTADTTAALAKLGDRGGSLIGLLGNGGEEIRKAAEDVNKFHLAITNLQGKQIEEMNDNFTRLGYSIQGAFNQFVATIAPVLAPIFITIANAIASTVGAFHYLGDVIQIVGPALAITFGPAIIAGVWALANAITGGAVRAMFALTAAIATNPLGALAIAIVTIAAAIWRFRDDIKKVFGIDVQAIVENAGEFIIRSFLTAYETIKDMWNNFPKVIASAAIGAANFMIDAINGMIRAAVGGINNLIDLADKVPGVSNIIGKIAPGTGEIGPMADPFAKDNADSAKVFQAKLKEIWETHYLDKIKTALGDLSKPAEVATTSMNGAASAADGLAASSAKAAAAASKLAKEAFSEVTKHAQAVQKQVEELRKSVMDTAGGAFKTFFSDIMQGKSAIDSLTDALKNLADKLMNMVLDNVLTGFIQALIPGPKIGSAFSGGWGSSGFKFAQGGALPANDNGISRYSGSVVSTPTIFPFAKGVGMMGEAGPEAILPLKRGPNGSLGVSSDSGGGATVVMLQPIINNNASDQVTASAHNGPDGNLIVTIDAINAGLMNDPGSKTHRATKNSFGLGNAVKVR